MVETLPTEAKIPLSDARSSKLMRRLFREAAWPYRWPMFAAVLCMGLVAGTTAATAWLLDPVVNKVFVERDQSMLMLIA